CAMRSASSRAAPHRLKRLRRDCAATMPRAPPLAGWGEVAQEWAARCTAPGLRAAEAGGCRDSLRGNWNIEPRAFGLLHPNIGRPDHLAPFLDIVRNEFPEFGWRACKGRVAAGVGETRLHFGVGQTRVDLLI